MKIAAYRTTLEKKANQATDVVCVCVLNMTPILSIVEGDFTFHRYRIYYFVWWPQIVCVCHAQIPSVFNKNITAQAWLPEIDVGKALGVLKIAFFHGFRAPEAISTCSEGPERLPEPPSTDFWYLGGISKETLVALEGLRDAVCPTSRIPLIIFSGLDGQIPGPDDAKYSCEREILRFVKA